MTNFELKVGGKTFAFNIGVIFLGQYIEKKNTDIETLFNDIQTRYLTIVPDLMYESAKYKNPSLKISRDEFFDLIDAEGFGMKSINDFLQRLTDSLTKNVPQEQGEESKDAKKK